MISFILGFLLFTLRFRGGKSTLDIPQWYNLSKKWVKSSNHVFKVLNDLNRTNCNDNAFPLFL